MRLLIKSGIAAGQAFEVDRELTVGRATTCEIVLADTGVSSRHAKLRPVAEGIEVTDLGSTNGTYADGQRFTGPRVVRPGEVLHFSNTETAVAPSVQVNLAAGNTAPRLIVRTGPNSGRETALAEGVDLVIGRANDAGLQLSDPRVSERNTRVRLVRDAIEVTDLGSANGTLLNGEPIAGVRRGVPGAEIQVGDSVVSFVVGAFDAGQLANPTIIGRSGSALHDASLERRVEAVVARRSRRLTVLATLMGVVAIGALSLGLWALLSGGSSASADEVVANVARDLTPATVRVLIVENGDVVSSGSGSIIDLDQGLILTNNHVIGSGQAEVSNTLFDEPLAADLVGTAYCDDLAVLQVPDLKSKVKGLKEIKLGDAATLRQGQRVVTLGYPRAATKFENFDLSVTSGVISKTRTVWDRPGSPFHDNVIQTDATINQGNSGGPLLNLKGEQIGVNTYTLSGAGIQQSNYAISIGRVREVLGTLQGGVSPKWIGARFTEVTDKNDEPVGIAIDTLYPGGIAEKAGLVPTLPDGSVPMYITEIDGRPVRTVADYCEAMPEKGKATLTVDGVNGEDSVRVEVGQTTQAK